jgi:hypothetical protein
MRTIAKRREDLKAQLKDLDTKVSIVVDNYNNQVKILKEEKDRRIRAVDQKIKALEIAHLQRMKRQDLTKIALERGIKELEGRGDESPDFFDESKPIPKSKIPLDMDFVNSNPHLKAIMDKLEKEKKS